MFGLLTRIRHGPLKKLRFFWSYLRYIYRIGLTITPNWSVSKKIGSYGPFKLNRRFAFSNFEAWGSRHNRGFTATVETSKGKTCVLDVGAHIGLVSLPVSQAISKAGKVYAFEPAMANQMYLVEHLTANNIDNVEVITDLVGESPLESVEFFESPQDSGMNTIAPVGSQHGYDSTQKRQITLDGFCDERNLSPQVIKIDTEGAEVRILKGAVDTIRLHKPIIFLSVHPGHIIELGSTVEELEQLLEDLNYKVTDVEGRVVRPVELTEYIVSPKKYSL
ncbi:MAG: FkbM family methyltransferase [Chloroflexota bacterium]|nr:FkbM family methyltransferase [Chloroflexota bacterium]